MKIDLQQIKELLGIVGTTDVTELTIEFGDQRITVKKEKTLVAQAFEVAAPQLVAPPVPLSPAALSPAVEGAVRPAPAPAAEPPKAGAADDAISANTVAITSPMVGTFSASPSPTAPAFVKMGDRVAVGQTVCIIEAMKLMNDLPSEVSGKIVKVCVDNGTTVEYGQTLFLIDPKG